MTPPFAVDPPGGSHDRRGCTCGVEPLDRHVHELVTQAVRRRIANCLVAVDVSGAVTRFYTLPADGLPVAEVVRRPQAG